MTDENPLKFDHLSVVGLDQAALIGDGFDPISRDSAGMMKVGIRLQKLLAIIAKNTNPIIAQAAAVQAVALQRAAKRFEIARNTRLLTETHRALFGVDEPAGDMAASRDKR